MLGSLTNDEVQNVLTSNAIGRLACCNEQQPYIMPVTYAYDGNYIYGQTNEGHKLKILRSNPNVCFEVEQITDMANWKSVIVFGQFEELEDEQAIKAKDFLFSSIFFLMTNSSVHAHEHKVSATITDDNRKKQVMYRIKIEKLTGRYEKQQ